MNDREFLTVEDVLELYVRSLERFGGVGAALVFLKLNGIVIDGPERRLYDAMIGFAERRLDKAGLGQLLRTLAAT